MTYNDMSDSAAASLGFERNADHAPVANGRLLHRVWSERNWAVAVLFASLLIGSWVMVIANEVNPIVGNTNWLRIVTSAILTGLLPVIALLVLHFASRHRNASAALALARVVCGTWPKPRPIGCGRWDRIFASRPLATGCRG